MNTLSKLLAWSALACASMALSGCTAVHSVVSPMMQSAMKNSVENNATPESMGISTSSYRGYDCAYLASMAQNFTKSQNDPATEAFIRKTFGWHVDAINQVRAEQGCVPGIVAKVPPSGEVPMYGFCWYAEPSGTGAVYISTVFAYADWYADRGQHEQQEFESLLKSRYAPKPATAICQGEDTRAKADAAREKLWGQMFGNLSSSRVSVAWTPVSRPPPRKPAARSKAAAVTPATAAALAPSGAGAGASSGASAGAGKVSGLQLSAVDEATAKKLGLNLAQGALVSDVAKGGTAAKAGLRALDVIVEIGGQEARTPEEAQAILDAMRPGFNAPLRVWRGRKMIELTLEVAGR